MKTRKVSGVAAAVAIVTVVAVIGSITEPASAGLVAHWEMEGNANDSADSHDGTIFGNPVPVPGVPHLGGQALAFDGNDYINVPHHSDLTPPDAMTVSAWFKPESFNMGSYSWPAILKKVSDAEMSGYVMEIGQVV